MVNEWFVSWFLSDKGSRAYQVFGGLMVCPWYAYSQTMISEVSPQPQMYGVTSLGRASLFMLNYRFLFFALFSVVSCPGFPLCICGCYWHFTQIGKTSAFIGPFITSAIITASGNNNMPFAFLFGLWVKICTNFAENLICRFQWNVQRHFSVVIGSRKEPYGMRGICSSGEPA